MQKSDLVYTRPGAEVDAFPDNILSDVYACFLEVY